MLPPPPPTAYEPVDVKKWASGMFKDEYIGHRVVIDGTYAPFQGALQSIVSTPNQIVFTIGSLAVPIIADAPLGLRDQIFALKQDQPIRVYGIVTPEPYNQLWITVERIEPR